MNGRPPPGTIDAEGPRGRRGLRREWAAQRVGWVAMAVAVGCGIALGAGEIVLRATAMYAFMLVILRIAGKRTFAQLTPFDLVLLLIISEVTQPALVPEGQDSYAAVLLSIVVLAGFDLLVGWLTWRSPALDDLVEGKALILVAHGKPDHERLGKERVTLDEIRAAARKVGLMRLDEIRYAILESDGELSIVPRARPRLRRRN